MYDIKNCKYNNTYITFIAVYLLLYFIDYILIYHGLLISKFVTQLTSFF